MICYLDRAFCCSPGCTGKCGRQLTDEIKAGAEATGLPISMGFFCGGPVVQPATPETDEESWKILDQLDPQGDNHGDG